MRTINSDQPIVEPKSDLYFSTGSTLLNLALTDKVNGGFVKRTMVNLIGDSSSGKTFLFLSLLAEAAHDERRKNYRLILDDVERANNFNVAKLFGQATADRIRPPRRDKDGEPIFSDTVQDFHDNLSRTTERGKPFIYGLDSYDGLTSEEEQNKVEAQRKAREKGKDVPGSYGADKAKASSQILRSCISKISKTDSLLVIISQTRANIGSMFTPKTRSGGMALKFYATHEMWMSCEEKIRVNKRIIGVRSKIKVSKNKITGKIREVSVSIYYDMGIDDVGDCVDFLVDEGYWPHKKDQIKANEFGGILKRDKLVRLIEDEGKESQLRSLVQNAWTKIENSILINRKKRYE